MSWLFARERNILPLNSLSSYSWCPGVVGLPGRVASWHARRTGLLLFLPGMVEGFTNAKWP